MQRSVLIRHRCRESCLGRDLDDVGSKLDSIVIHGCLLPNTMAKRAQCSATCFQLWQSRTRTWVQLNGASLTRVHEARWRISLDVFASVIDRDQQKCKRLLGLLRARIQLASDRRARNHDSSAHLSRPASKHSIDLMESASLMPPNRHRDTF